ncbi:MAG: phage shock protein [Chloroflexota bacterium]|nr:phage shock protein [Chloroflexota bacterium]
MSVFRRLSMVFQQKANRVLDKAENPAEALDLSYEKMLENLQTVRRSIADVLTSQKRLEAQRDTLQQQFETLQGHARLAVQQGQDDLARTALSRAQLVRVQVEGLDPQIEQLRQQEQQLEVVGEKLRGKVEAFRGQRETMKAQYSAAKASTKAMEGVTGLSEQMADVSLMIDRARGKVADMQARAAAVGQLAETGALDSLGPGDDLEARLRISSAESTVDGQLLEMKRQLALEAPADLPRLEAAGIVVRIAGDDQYRLPANARSALEGMDEDLARAIEQDSAEDFARLTRRLVTFVNDMGERLPHDDVRGSDLIVPASDMSLADAKKLLDAGASGPGA